MGTLNLTRIIMRRSTLSFLVLSVALSCASWAGPSFEADLDGSGEIDFIDLLILAQQWQTLGPDGGGTQVGWETGLSGSATYGVSGKAIVTSATSIRLENFNFFDNGPDVFVYLVIASGSGDFTRDEGIAGLSIFPFPNNDEVYTNETLDLTLPPGETISPYTHLSVWRRQASADFGSGRFEAPTGKKE